MNKFLVSAKTFSQNNPWLWKALLAVLLLGGVFFAGRQSAPTKTVEKEKIVTVDHEVVKTVTQVIYQKVYIKVKQDDSHKEITTITHPDGTKETKVVIDDHQHEQVNEATSQATQQQTVASKDLTTVLEKEKTVDLTKPEWHMAIQAGAGARFIGQLTPTLVLGVSAERRILGPLFLGVWVQTTLNLPTLSVPPYGLNGGVSVGFEL